MSNLGYSALVTIAIPTYNRANYLSDTVRSTINQTYDNLDIIVSDNCSDDNTSEVVKSFSDPRIRYFRQQENLGMVGNWNFCLEQAKGKFFLILSDDDLLDPMAIEKMVACLENESISFVYSRFIYIDENCTNVGVARSAPRIESGSDFIINSLLHRREVMPSALLHKTVDALEIGGYSDVGTVADLVFRFSLASKNKVVFIDEILMKYRVHSSSLSNGVGGVVQSLCLFYEMSQDVNSFLYEYNKMVRRYITKDLRNKALRGQFVNANICEKDMAFKLFCDVDTSKYTSIIFRLYKTFPLRVSFNYLKKLRNMIRKSTFIGYGS